MAKKHILTDAEIEKDIIHALKNPPKESEKSYKRWKAPCIIIAVLLFVMCFIYLKFIIWFWLALLVVCVTGSIFCYFRLRNKTKNININDYIISTEIVHSVDEEHYEAVKYRRTGARRREQTDNYIIRFESGKSWHVPKELYGWDERLRMRDGRIFNSTHRGDAMIVLTEKRSDKIVVAYNTEIFDYNDR